MTTSAIILAAGQGTRMKSSLPKVLHTICGRAMIDWIVQTALDAGAEDAVVVVGHERETVEHHLASRFGERVRTAVQPEQKGTGHAVSCGLPALRDEAKSVLLLYGDTPLLQAEDLRLAVNAREAGKTPLAMLTCLVDDPTGYGRVLRDEHGNVARVREHRDASADERLIAEINPGIYVAEVDFLTKALNDLIPNNDQGELYLTDIVSAAAETGGVSDLRADAATLVGVNDRTQLAAVEEVMYQRIADRWRRAGNTVRTTARIDAEVTLGQDARIEHGVVLRGATTIGDQATVDVGSVLEHVTVAARARVLPYTVAQQSTIGEEAQVGPFCHLRRATELGARSKVGNFVETKKTRMHEGAKASHLAYLGDGDIGEGANVGAGTIFCNYDGFQKHRTVVEAGAFIGSDSQIVAPVTIGRGAYVATGTTVTKDVPADALAIARTKQANKEGYASRLKARLQAAKKRASDES